MVKKKRQKSSCTVADATSQSARTGAVDRTAGTTDASVKVSHGSSAVDARPSNAHPEKMLAPPSDPRGGKAHSSAHRPRKAKNKRHKAPSALGEDAPASTTKGTDIAALRIVETTAGAKDAGCVNTRRSSAFTMLSPPGQLERSQSGLGPQGTLGATTSASHVTDAVAPLDYVLVFGHGKFQWINLFCTQLTIFCTVVHAVAMLSLARPVDHWCRPPVGYGNLLPEMWKNSSIPVEEDGSYSRCFRYEPPFAPYDVGVNLSSTVPCDAGWDYAASIHTSITAEWDLVCHRRWILHAMMASYMCSAVVFMPFTGVVADRIGRTPVLVVALFVLIAAGTTLAFATTLLVFTILRVFISVSSGTLLVVSVVLLFEVTDSSRRVLYSSVAIAGGVSAANVYGEIMYDLANEWALIQMINMLPSVLLIGAVHIVQESPNWLLATNRVRRLCKVVMAAAQTNGADLKRVAKHLDVIRKENRRSRSESFSEGVNEASPLEVLTNPSFRSETLVAFGCWFLAMSLFHELRGSREARYVYFVQIALECPTVTANIILLERKGRRIATAISMIVLACLVAALGAFSLVLPGKAYFNHRGFKGTLAELNLFRRLDQSSGKLLLSTHKKRGHKAGTTLAKGGGDIKPTKFWKPPIADTSGADGLARHIETALRVAAMLAVDSVVVSLCVITVEMYPTVLRVSGLAFAYVCGRLGAISAAFGSSDSRLGRGIQFGVVSLLLVAFGALALVVMPETTKIHATNTFSPVVDARTADKWMLDAPLRLARGRRASSVADERRKSSGASR
ncbi:solute carrier family 22 member 7 [Dermacentor silvarum]|uniref:solute carrier family 22 member 7 n=1 Tax=Dermacentor silvarum TaxID=543639 RepID=UPI0021013823|nr:solute carrier family 22 member 7 [Dermacentor silvarum]